MADREVNWRQVSPADSRLAALLEQPVARALREAAGVTLCHLVGGVLRDRLLGIRSGDYDAVVGARGAEIAERLADRLPARLVPLGGKAFAAYRLVGDGFTLDLWDRSGQSLESDLARRDFTVNAFALDLVSGTVSDPFGGRADLERRLLRATTDEVFGDDPLRVLRLVRLALQLRGFAPLPATLELARAASPALAGVAAERVREEIGRILAADDFLPGFTRLAALDLYPGLLRGQPGEPGDAEPARRALARLEPALAELASGPPTPHGELDPASARLATLFAALTPGDRDAARRLLRRYREAGYLAGEPAALCGRLLASRSLPTAETEARWFLHVWDRGWPTAVAVLAALSEPPPAAGEWRRLARRLAELAARHGDELFAPRPLLDGHRIQRLLGVGPGPEVGAAAERLRRAQVEGRVRDRAAAERLLLRSSASGAD